MMVERTLKTLAGKDASKRVLVIERGDGASPIDTKCSTTRAL